MKQKSKTRASHTSSLAGSLGLLSGVAAATVGTVAIAGGVRLWHVLAIAAAMLAVVADNGRSVGSLRLRAVDLLAVCFIVVTVVTDLGNGAELNFRADVVGALTPVFYFLLFWIARAMVSNLVDLERFLLMFVAPAVPVAMLSIGQMLAPGAFSWVTAVAPSGALEGRLDGGGALRATGLVGDWTGNGFYFSSTSGSGFVGPDTSAGRTARWLSDSPTCRHCRWRRPRIPHFGCSHHCWGYGFGTTVG